MYFLLLLNWKSERLKTSEPRKKYLKTKKRPQTKKPRIEKMLRTKKLKMNKRPKMEKPKIEKMKKSRTKKLDMEKPKKV